ncbi:unnamed protein product, partial [Thlaspi arvense]
MLIYSIALSREATVDTAGEVRSWVSPSSMWRMHRRRNEMRLKMEKKMMLLVEFEEWENPGGAETPKNSVNVIGRRAFGETAIKIMMKWLVGDNTSPARNTGTITETEIDDVAGNPAPKTTFDVALFASGSWKKVCFEYFESDL